MTMSRQAVRARSRAAPSFIRSSWRESVMAESSLSLFQSHFSCRRAHAAFLGEAIPALGEDVKLAVLRQQFDLNAEASLPPWLVEEFFLELAQPAFGRADEIAHRRIGGAHLRKNLFGGHAAIIQSQISPANASELLSERRAEGRRRRPEPAGKAGFGPFGRNQGPGAESGGPSAPFVFVI